MLGHLRHLLVIAALSLLLAACGSEGGDGDGTGDGGGTITIPSEPEPDAPTLGEIIAQEAANREAREQKVNSDAEALGPLLNGFWTRELSSQYQLTFDPPDRYEYYRGEQQTSCGGVTEPRANNAYYCPADNDEHVAFDLDWFQQYLVNHPGGATSFLILAHEWGHAVQDTWLENDGGDTWNPANRQELNADCLAGVFLAASIRDGTIVEEAGDANAIFGWLYEAGGPWLAPGTHGTREERQAAFRDGFRENTPYCRTEY